LRLAVDGTDDLGSCTAVWGTEICPAKEMMMRKRHAIRAIMITALTSVLTATGAEQIQLSRYSHDGGGIMRCAQGSIELSGTIGQPDVGVLSAGNVTVVGGFWFGADPGDCNTDGSVGLADYEDWLMCLVGPADHLSGSCSCFDFDADGDVDLLDIGEFQTCFQGN